MEIYKSDISKDVKQPVSHTGGGSGIYANQGEISVGGMNLATQTWTEDNYISKKFFNKLFLVHGDGTTSIEANDLSTAIESLEAKIGLWTNSYISALGQNSSQGGGSGTSYNRLDAWSNYDSTKSGWVLSALLGNDLNTRLTVLENGVAPISHTHNWSDITNTPTTLNGYGITDAYISNGAITIGTNTITPITSLAGYATEDWVTSKGYLVSSDIVTKSDNDHTHAVKINSKEYTIPKSGESSVDLGTYLPYSKLSGVISVWTGINNATTGPDSDFGGGFLFEGNTGTGFKIWNHDTSYYLWKTVAGGAWKKMYAGYADTAGTASALKTNAGSSTNPVYFSGGVPVATSYTFGNANGNAAVSNGTVCTNLNADLLDGVHLAGFGGHSGVMRSWGRSAYTSANQYFGNGNVVTIDHIGTGCLSENDTILSLGDLDNRNTQLLVSWDRDGLYYRRITDPVNYGSWKRLAFLTDNVDSATKLQTARTLWGQSFDGTANIDGMLTGWTGCCTTLTDVWSDGRNTHPWYGIDHRYTNTGVYSTTISDYFGLTLKTANGIICMPKNGNVGIGTFAPSYKLDVVGNVRVSCNEGEGLRIKNLDGKYSAIKFADSTGTDKAAIHYFHADMRNNPSANTLNLQSPIVSLGDWQNPTVYVNSDNRYVGIRTIPRAELDVNGNALIGGTLYISTGGYHESVSGNVYSVISVPDNHHKIILRGDVTTTAENSYTTGNVITFAEWGGLWRFRKTTTSENTLLVELGETSTFNGTIHATVGIYTEGYVSALGQNTSSDIRLKDVQGDVDLPIDMLANAPSKAFVWKGNKALGEQVGTIAQYWQKHLPQVVHDNNGYLAMQYDVTALLGVISLAKNVKSHEERIAELEREIEMLNQELETLKN